MLKNHEDSSSQTIREVREEFKKKGKIFFHPDTLNELMDEHFPDSTWLIEGILPSAGITIMSGNPSTFKTWLFLEMAICLASGRDLFGVFSVDTVPVLIIDEESGKKRLQARLKSLGVDKSLPIFFSSMQDFRLDQKTVEEVIKFCEENSVELVIFDSLVRLHLQDENDAGQTAILFSYLRKFNSKGISVLVIHHNRKQGVGKKDLSQEMRGSINILASVDCHIALTREDKEIKITQTKSRDSEEIDPIEIKIVSDEDSFGFEYLGRLEKTQTKSVISAKQTLGIITSSPEINQKDLHLALNLRGNPISIRSLRDLLGKLEKDGKIYSLKGQRNTKLYKIRPNKLNDSTAKK